MARVAVRPITGTWLLTAAIASAAAALMIRMPARPTHAGLGVVALVVVTAVLCELVMIHVEVGQHAHSLTMNEISLVLGMLVATPTQTILIRALACVGTRLLRRQRVEKLCFNTAISLLESTIAFRVVMLMTASSTIATRSWPAIGVAVLLSDALTAALVSAVIRIHGGDVDPFRQILFASLTGAANTSVSVVAAILVIDDTAALVPLAGVATVVVVSYRGYARLSQRHAGLRRLHGFSRALSASTNAEAAMSVILDQALSLLHASEAEVMLNGPDRDSGAVRMVRTRTGESRTDVCDRVTNGEPDSGLSPIPVWQRAIGRRAGGHDSLAAPLSFDGEPFGRLRVVGRIGDVSTFDADDARMLETMANQASVTLQNIRLVDQLLAESRQREFTALHDALTGLPNRALFFDQVASALEIHGCVAVLLMDLDHFKEVNDSLGHQTGDQLLRLVARRLAGAVPAGATVARLGGDEFAVCLALDEGSESLRTARSLRAAIDEPFRIDGVTLRLGGSVGISTSPAHGCDPLTLLQRADIAMYAAKGRTGVAVYEPGGEAGRARRLAVAAALRQAIEHREVAIVYQPKWRLSDRQIVGVEALARWTHEDLGVIGPDEFIPLAEQSGLVTQLTAAVLDESLECLRTWLAAGHDVSMAVNVSARSLIDHDFPDIVAGSLSAHAVPADRLVLEITESSIMTDPKRAMRIIDVMAQRGIGLAIDDFGTGYSSMSYLQRLPANELKIDKSFTQAMITDAGSTSIVRSIITLGHSLALVAVAEGIEDEATCAALVEAGCDVGQGYLVSPPVTADDVLSLLRAQDERRRPGAHSLVEPARRDHRTTGPSALVVDQTPGPVAT